MDSSPWEESKLPMLLLLMLFCQVTAWIFDCYCTLTLQPHTHSEREKKRERLRAVCITREAEKEHYLTFTATLRWIMLHLLSWPSLSIFLFTCFSITYSASMTSLLSTYTNTPTHTNMHIHTPTLPVCVTPMWAYFWKARHFIRNALWKGQRARHQRGQKEWERKWLSVC